MTSLGYRSDVNRAGHRNADNGHATPAPRLPVTVTDPAPCSRTRLVCNWPVMRGLLPCSIFAAFSFALVYMYIYGDYAYDETNTRVTTIVLTSVAALLLVQANCCVCLYNSVLAAHIAIEVRIIDLLVRYARVDDRTDSQMGISIATICVIILHLFPFLCSDNGHLLTFLAVVGVGVNTAAVLYLDTGETSLRYDASPLDVNNTTVTTSNVDDSPLLLPVAFSSLFLQVVTMLVVGVQDLCASFYSLAKCAYKERRMLHVAHFEL